MTIKIKTITNGFLLTDSSGEATAFTVGTEQETFIKLVETLWHDYFGESYNKYGTDNIEITFKKKGHKLQ